MEKDDERYCPNCKKDITAANFDVHFAHCSRNLVLCSRCHEPVPVNDKDHVREKHCQVECEDCGLKMERWELDGDHKEICPRRLETCQYCDVELSFDLLQDHIDNCGSRTDPCPLCKKRVVRKEKEAHMREKCSKRLVSCTNCQLPYSFDELGDHMELCMPDLRQSRQEIEQGKTKGSRPKKPHTHDVTSIQGSAVPCDNIYQCAICKDHVPSKEFRAHYESCIENSRRLNLFPRNDKTGNTGYEHVRSSSRKTEESSDDSTSSDEKEDGHDNQATRLNPTNNQFRGPESRNEFLRENPSSANKKLRQESEQGKTKGSRPKKPHTQNVMSSQGGVVPYDENDEEHDKIYQCAICKDHVPSNEFGAHYESCIENSRRLNQFPRNDKTGSTGYEHVRSSSRKTEESFDDSTSSDEKEDGHDNKATRVNPTSNQFRVPESHNEFLRENSSSADKKLVAKTILGKSRDSQFAVHDAKDYTKQYSHRTFALECACGKDVLQEELSDHEKNCPANTRRCKHCHKKFAASEYRNHLQECPMSVVVCENCDEKFLRYKQENHFCASSVTKNKKKIKARGLKQTDSLTVVNKLRSTESEDDEKTEYCKFCQRYFTVNQFAEHFKSCFMSPMECKVCVGIFPVDEFHNHTCNKFAKRNRTGTEDQQFHPPSAGRILAGSLESKKLPVGQSEYQQKNQVIQGTDLTTKGKYCSENDAEYPQYLENLNHGAKDDKLPSHVSNYSQMSARFQGIQNRGDDSGELQMELCKFCMHQFEAEDLEEHLSRCSARYTKCGKCGSDVKFKELENHRKLCNKMANCKFCRNRFPASELVKHTSSCSMLPVLCQLCGNDFPKNEIRDHVCSEGNDSQDTRRNLKSDRSRRVQESMKHLQHYEENVEPNENGDQPMEVDQTVEGQSTLKGGHQAEIFSRAGELASTSFGAEGVANDGKQLTEEFFECKICCRKKPMEDLSISIYNTSEISVCINCIRNFGQLNMEFRGDPYFNATSPPKEDDSESAVKETKGNAQDVRLCEFCDRYPPVDAWEEHTKTCENRLLECPRCKAFMLLGDKEKHEQICSGIEENYFDSNDRTNHSGNKGKPRQDITDDSMERMRCQYCLELQRGSVEEHEKMCGIRFRKCPKCARSVQLRYMKMSCESGHNMKKEFMSLPGSALRVVPPIPPTAEEHENSENEKKQAAGPKNCDACGKPLSFAEIADHKNKCEMRIEPCLFCERRILHCLKWEHIREECLQAKSQAAIPYKEQKQEEKRGGLLDKVASKFLPSRQPQTSPQERANFPQHGSGAKRPQQGTDNRWRQQGNNDRRHHQHGNDRRKPSDNNRCTQQKDLSPAYHGNVIYPEPVKIPCEFCHLMFDAEELILHESGCRPELFIGSSEHGTEGGMTPENRLHTDFNEYRNRIQRERDLRETDRGTQDPRPQNRTTIFRPYSGHLENEMSSGDHNAAENNMTNPRRNASNGNIPRPGTEQENCEKYGSQNRTNIFSRHPLDDDELEDVRFVRHNKMSSGDHNAAENNMTKPRRNASNDNIPRRGTEQQENNCEECRHIDRPEVPQWSASKQGYPQDELRARPHDAMYKSETQGKEVPDFQTKMERYGHDYEHSQERKLPSHLMSPENKVPSQQNDGSVSFSYVGKAEERNVSSAGVNAIPDVYQREKLSQNANSRHEIGSIFFGNKTRDWQHSGMRSNDGEFSVKITYKEGKRNTTLEGGDDNSEMYARQSADPRLHQIKQYEGGSQTKKSSGLFSRELSDSGNKDYYVRQSADPRLHQRKQYEGGSQTKKSSGVFSIELSDSGIEDHVKNLGQNPRTEQPHVSDTMHHEQIQDSDEEGIQKLLADMHLSDSNVKHRSTEHKERCFPEYQQSLTSGQQDSQRNRFAEGSYSVSGKSSNPRPHNLPRDSDKQQGNFNLTSGKPSEKSAQAGQNDKKASNNDNQNKSSRHRTHGNKGNRGSFNMNERRRLK